MAAEIRNLASTESYARDMGRAADLEAAALHVHTMREAFIAVTAAGIKRDDYIWRTLNLPF